MCPPNGQTEKRRAVGAGLARPEKKTKKTRAVGADDEYYISVVISNVCEKSLILRYF